MLERSAQEELYDLWGADPLLWGYQMFPHHFRMEAPGFHQDLMDGAISEDWLAVAAPR